jgi:hypothetical protein
MFGNDIVNRAARLSAGAYDLPKAGHWQKKNMYNGTVTHYKTIPLAKNLVGDVGRLTVGISKYEEDIYISFNGTQDVEFWLYNLDTHTVACPGGYVIHKGFYDLAREIVQFLEGLSSNEWPREVATIFRNYTGNIYWTGHSAGAAVAGLCSIMIPRRGFFSKPETFGVIDFGSPRYIASESKVPEIPRVRYQDVMDLVACTPLKWRGPLSGFKHWGDVQWLDNMKAVPKQPLMRIPKMIWAYLHTTWSLSTATTILDYHSMTRYLAGVTYNSIYEKESVQ